ncbi:MAG: hydroxyacid dehydrogenase [Oscillospiraceae bacterium]|nr:hydroxyacid dehydrogenase [Oscillospiraceae bacterium]
MPNAVILDAATLGDDLSFAPLDALTTLTIHQLTAPAEIPARIADADIVICNKLRLCQTNLSGTHVKLICVTATGYDNIDIHYCRAHGIAVCNVRGYSTDSVAQLTVAMVLELTMKLSARHQFVQSGAYTASGVANQLTPPFHELCGKTWGILGAGNIGNKVATIAEAFGCNVLLSRRSGGVDLPSLLAQSDILTIHTPLTDETRGLLSRDRIAQMKPGAILVNVSRGAVTDEAALAAALERGHLGGLGVDVYSQEPFPEDHPFYPLRHHPNICLTPHMAWAAIEARQRCIDEIGENIRSFLSHQTRNRVEL